MVRGIVARWERFWFRQIPGDVYGLLRIVVGLIGLFGLFGTLPPGMFWSPDGVAPLPGDGGLRAWLMSAGAGDAAGWTFLAALMLSFACMTVGFATPLAVAASFLGSVAQAGWNNLPLSGSHHLLVAVLFVLVWADCRAFSLDRRRGWFQAGDAETASIWPLRLLQVQVALVYFNSGVLKFLDESWRDGSALYYALSLNDYQRFPWEIPAGLGGLLAAATYLTLAWEIAFPLLVLHRWTRRVVLVFGVMMHLGMALLLEVGTFSWLMMATYLAFVDPTATARATARYARVPGGQRQATVAAVTAE